MRAMAGWALAPGQETPARPSFWAAAASRFPALAVPGGPRVTRGSGISACLSTAPEHKRGWPAEENRAHCRRSALHAILYADVSGAQMLIDLFAAVMKCLASDRSE
jgi:hypothetical protein